MKTIKKRSIAIDLFKNTIIPLPKFIQNDHNVLEFTIKENGATADLSNIGRIVVNYKRPDNHVTTRELFEENGVVSYKIGLPEMEVPGRAKIELQFYSQDATERVSTKSFEVEILPSIGEGKIETEEEYTLLQTLLMDVQEKVTQVEQATTNANNAAQYAQEQGNRVDDSITDLNNLIDETNTAITNANQATINANDASENANNQATYAQEQGNYANEQGNYAKQEADRLANTDVAHLDAKVGDLSQLQTENKDSLVESVNETVSQLAQRPNVISSLTPVGKTHYIGHRGLPRLAPEGTLSALQLVAEYGLWGCEFDIQLTSDGVWVVFHDSTLDALTNGTGAVSSLTLAQIKELVIDGGSNVAIYPNQKILTLEEAIVSCRDLGVIPCIEIKSTYSATNLDNLVSIIKDNGIEDKCFILGDRVLCDEIRSRSKLIGLMMFATSEELTYIPTLGNAMASMNYANIASKDFVEYLHGLGILVNAFTVNDPNEAKKLESWGVDFISTDVLIGGAR